MKRTRRKVLFWLMGVVALLLLLIVAMPLWFPWLLGPLGGKAGLQYGTYVREGYSRFQLQAVSYTNAHMQVTAQQIRLFVPSIWMWHHLGREKSVHYAEVTDWKVTIVSASTEQRRPEASTYTNAQRIGAIVGKIDHWLPGIALTNGSVEFSKRPIEIEQLVLQNGTFRSTVKPGGVPASMSLEGRLGPEAPWQLKASYAPWHLIAEMHAVHSASNMIVSGAVFFETNGFDFNARFGRAASLPEQASLTCASFSIPAGRINLENYNDVKGALSVLWKGDSFASEISAKAAPTRDSKLPAVDVRLSGRGDLHQAQIDQFKVEIPGIQAELANSVTFPMTEYAPPAVLNVSANLAQQPWVPLEGTALGQVRLTRGTNS